MKALIQAVQTGQCPRGQKSDFLSVVYQDVVDRLLGVGLVRIATAGTSEYEIEVPGLPDPYTIKGLVDKLNGSLKLKTIGRMPEISRPEL